MNSGENFQELKMKLNTYEKFNVEYSEMQVWRMLTSWNMHHAKPYVLDKRRPDDAETILKKLDS